MRTLELPNAECPTLVIRQVGNGWHVTEFAADADKESFEQVAIEPGSLANYVLAWAKAVRPQPADADPGRIAMPEPEMEAKSEAKPRKRRKPRYEVSGPAIEATEQPGKRKPPRPPALQRSI